MKKTNESPISLILLLVLVIGFFKLLKEFDVLLLLSIIVLILALIAKYIMFWKSIQR